MKIRTLGLPASELARHIAWDIGAAGVTEALSEIFDAPDLIAEVSDGTVIPGNLHLSEGEKQGQVVLKD